MEKEIHYCENTNHDFSGSMKNVIKTKLIEDFGNDECYWCENCRKRDNDMIENLNFIN